MRLKELQAQVSRAIKYNNWKSLSSVVVPGTVGVQSRVNVYHLSYWGRMIETLEGDFSGVKKLLGDKKFESVSREYIKKHPSRSPTLNKLITSFSDFIQKQKLSQQVKEMAFFENQLVEVFFTPKKSSTMIEDLKKYGTRDMKSLRLVPHPSLRLLQFHRPVHKAKALVVFNQGGTVYWRPVAKSEWVCLQRLLKGDSVADLAQLAKKNKLSAKKTQSMTKTWTEDGLVLGLKPLSTKVPKAQSRF